MIKSQGFKFGGLKAESRVFRRKEVIHPSVQGKTV